MLDRFAGLGALRTYGWVEWGLIPIRFLPEPVPRASEEEGRRRRNRAFCWWVLSKKQAP